MSRLRRVEPVLLPFVFALFFGIACADTDPGSESNDDTGTTDVVDDQMVDDAASDPDITEDPEEDQIVITDADDDIEDAIGEDADAFVDADVLVESDLNESGEDCTNGEDDDDDERVDCHDPDCFDRPACEGVNPAPFIEPVRWRRTWSDEFNGPEPGNEACYNTETTPPQCLTLYWHNETCPVETHPGLADLNKCNWSVFYMYNWMDWGKPLGEGVNSFAPEHVTVTGGELILSASAAIPAGGLDSGWSIERLLQEYDCGNPPASGHNISKDCPILAGGIWSKQMGDVLGLLQTYGRFEIRARLPVGPGSWPAHWMLPQEGPWPGDGEIDIMEATSHHPTYVADDVAANFHDGVTVEIDGETVNTHMSQGAMSQDMTETQQTDEYHIYAAEWEPDVLRFFVDDILIGTVVEGTLLRNKDLETGEVVGNYPVEVPDEDFHMILNSSVTAFNDNDWPDPRTFSDQFHYIDYVRAWEVCDDPADACPHGGTFDGANCLVGALPDRTDVFVHEDSLVYPALAGAADCPDGGLRTDDLCVVYDIDVDVHTFIEGQSFFIQTACLESTISDSPRCQYPCDGLGRYEGRECYVGAPPEGARVQVVDDTFMYRPFLDGSERCPVGRDWGNWCEIGAVPEGRTGRVNFLGDAMYLSAVCAPADFMPNCTEPCPEGAEWDGEDCHVGTPPPDNSPFVWENGFYYGYLDTNVYAARCPLGDDDGAHCFVGRPGDGWTPMIKDGAFFVKAACENVPLVEED